MSWTSQLLDGLAQHLHDRGLGVYRPNGVYLPGDIAIVVGTLPPTPDRVICLTSYNVSRPGGLATAAVMVQIRVRGPAGDSRSADAIGDPVCEELDDARDLVLGGIPVTQILHASGPAPIGTDALGRPERTDNHQVWAERPTAAYPD
ncbi:minor capsid protein [Yinghuangia soli]|uniref:Minor capsid protein n=1 Tax=Yinghuangia soli TaxID=2908204 RepID=A0AA41U3E7_9ACTN|nr:minor capsid protein [Yinghuangia soli]MCF2531750.1 minor capsid protein [Yinghuangia soli]